MTFLPIKHSNPAFSKMVGEVAGELEEMFKLSMVALESACLALEKNDTTLAKQTIGKDDAINRLEEKVSLGIATVLARHQPVAHDLHALMGSVKVAQELERIADHAKNICRRLRHITAGTEAIFHAELVDLGKRTLAMLAEFFAANQADDYERAVAVRERDSKVNDLCDAIVTRALEGEGKDDPRSLVNSLFIAKDFERIGDRIKNLTEIIHYQRTGKSLDFDEETDV